jgi:hypothetical protein
MTNTINDDSVISFDMRFHAFVLAVPRSAAGIVSPVVAMSGGDERQLVAALRVIADWIESGGTEILQ